MSRSFIATRDTPKTPCPLCCVKLAAGDEVEYQPLQYPHCSTVGCSPRDLKRWHSDCVRLAYAEGLCDVCGALHRPGECLI